MHPLFPITALLLLIPSQQGRENEVIERIRDVAGLDVDASRQFFSSLKRAVLSGDKVAVSKMMRYPLKANISNPKRNQVASSDEFIKHYDEILNEAVVRAIREQEFNELFVNYQGIMIGSGEFWINATRDSNAKAGRMCVITINN
jgi:hypothetical protein